MDPEKKSLNFIFPTKYVIPKSLKFSHWPSKKRLWYRGDDPRMLASDRQPTLLVILAKCHQKAHLTSSLTND